MISIKARLIMFNIIIYGFVFVLLIIGVLLYGINTKEGAAIIIGSAIGVLIGISLDSIMFREKYFK